MTNTSTAGEPHPIPADKPSGGELREAVEALKAHRDGGSPYALLPKHMDALLSVLALLPNQQRVEELETAPRPLRPQP